MRVITGKEDISIQLDITAITGEEMEIDMFAKFNITVFTEDEDIKPQFTKEDIKGNILSIDSDSLMALETGQISLKIEWAVFDDSYPDGTYDQIVYRYLDFYLKKKEGDIQETDTDNK